MLNFDLHQACHQNPPRSRIENTNEDWGSLLASLRELTEWVSDNNNNNILIVITIIKRVSRW